MFFPKTIPKPSPSPSPTPVRETSGFMALVSTTNWKVYTSGKWGWVAKYPENWLIVVGGRNCTLPGGGEGTEDSICFFSPDFNYDSSSGFGFQVFSRQFDPDFVNSCFSLPSDQCQELTIAGQKATKFPTLYTQPEILAEEMYEFSFPNKVQIALTFNYFPCEQIQSTGCTKKEDAEKLIQQILSTFQFTN